MATKNWQGVGSATPSSDPKAKPNEGSATAPTQRRWQGAECAQPPSDPTVKPAGSAKIPGA